MHRSPPVIVRSEPVVIRTLGLEGTIDVPAQPEAVIVFAHGSGSSRHSPRNRNVAQVLQRAGLATLLFDLLTEAEAADRKNVFDIALLATRLSAAVACVAAHNATAGLPVGLFGASTGAAAALAAAATQPDDIGAIVARGGRPDLAGERHLQRVAAPTLLIVGGADREVLHLNEAARSLMSCPSELEVIPGAGHLFEEPGALDEVAKLAADWFLRWLTPQASQDAR